MQLYPPLRDVFTPTSPSLVELAKRVIVPLGPPTKEELRESEVRRRAVTFYYLCWAILRTRLRSLRPPPFELRRAVEFAAVVYHLSQVLRPDRILDLLNSRSEEFLEEALGEAVHGTFSRPFRKERWRAVEPYLDEIADPIRNRDAQEVLTDLNPGCLRLIAQAVVERDPETDRPSDADLEHFVTLASKMGSRIEDELSRSVFAEDHRWPSRRAKRLRSLVSSVEYGGWVEAEPTRTVIDRRCFKSYQTLDPLEEVRKDLPLLHTRLNGEGRALLEVMREVGPNISAASRELGWGRHRTERVYEELKRTAAEL